MKQSTNKSIDPKEITTKKINLPKDERFWFWQQPEYQKQQNRWIRWLWWLVDYIFGKKDWDIRYDEANRKIKVNNSKPLNKEINDLLVYDTRVLYLEWDHVIYNWLLYRNNINWNSNLPNTLNGWGVTNIIDTDYPKDMVYATEHITSNINVAPNVWTTISNTNGIVCNDVTKINTWQWIFVKDAWIYQVQSNILWGEHKANITRESRILEIKSDSTQKILWFDVFEFPNITATTMTTWTDSEWWSINATSTTTVTIEDINIATNKCNYYWYINKGSYIIHQVRHNSDENINVWWSSNPQNNITWSNLYLYRT